LFDRRGREKTQKRRNEPGKKNLKPVVSKISEGLGGGGLTSIRTPAKGGPRKEGTNRERRT
jgi:hypothetical protein